jgi:serine/threonine protein kinase
MRPERMVEMGSSVGSSFHSNSFASDPQYAYSQSSATNRDSSVAFCLGQPPHPTRAGEVLCRHCGSLVAGTQLGVYQVQRQLGRGRNGSAYLATHIRSQQPVVIKLFPPDPSSIGLWEAVRKEVRTITSLRHSAILPVFSCTLWHPDTQPGNTRPLHELMMSYPQQEIYLLTLRQYVPSTLSQYVAQYERSEMQTALRRRGIEPLAHLLHLVQQISIALSAIHARGLVHSGVIPANMLIDEHEHVWLADSGLTRLHPTSTSYLAPELQIVSSACIQTGNMAPYWNAVTPASDQYMLAVLCQQLFSRLLRSTEYEHLQLVLQCATQNRPAQRFASVEVFMHELLVHANQPSLLTVAQKQLGSGDRHGQPHPTSVSMAGTGLNPASTPNLPSGHYTQTSGQHTPVLPERYQRMDGYRLASSMPKSPADDWEKLGGKMFTSRDYSGAVKAYLRALELDAQKATLWLALGDAYFALENYAEALEAYAQAVQRNPNDPLAWSNRGTALDALGRHKEAEECYERADQLHA